MLLTGGTLPEGPAGPPPEPQLIIWLFSLGAGATWQEIAAWQSLRGLRLSGWERDTLHFLSQRLEAMRQNPELKSPWPMSGEETKAMFMSIFGGGA